MTPDNPQLTTDVIRTAIQFINSTNCHIFLTGKAGTGKTTFLKNLTNQTHKQLAVVAPTGIAALNAGGVTIHSQFLLPLGMFLPDRNVSSEIVPEGNVYTTHMLARKHPINSARKQVLRSIDLLVIDEVSMLRADLLDAIDYRLKAARGNFSQSFGGVQLLLIGDLYQLPPVVRNEDETILKRYYNSPWFFEARALKGSNLVYIELDKIFRQQNDVFINLLNNLRNNTPTHSDIELLNQFYKTEEEIREMSEVITLTTHNYKADELNTRALKQLPAPLHVFTADITGDFPPHLYPVLPNLELKEGAQIMFVKNDSEEKMYFNGKLATVKRIAAGEVVVELAGSHDEYILRKETWENKRYILDSDTQEIGDEVIGTFEQYPVKLAWAITVHKSQGLTFDKAIIDVGKAFADGQVYVALSRLRSLDGLILRTRISPGTIGTDSLIVTFSEANNQPDILPQVMKDRQADYIRSLISGTFTFDSILKEIQYIRRGYVENETGFNDESMKPVLEQIANAILAEKSNTEKFRKQLSDLLSENDHETLLQRIKKGSDYYKKFLHAQVKSLLIHLEEMKHHKRMKGYTNSLQDLDQVFAKKLEEIDKCLLLTESILQNSDHYNFSALSEQRAAERNNLMEEAKATVKLVAKPTVQKTRKKQKKDGPGTYEVTLALFNTGMPVAQIAKERGLATGTIEGHLARAVASGALSVLKFMTEEQVAEINEAVKTVTGDVSLKVIYEKLGGRYSYGQLRAALSGLEGMKEASKPSV